MVKRLRTTGIEKGIITNRGVRQGSSLLTHFEEMENDN
jgi:hypothetical protein